MDVTADSDGTANGLNVGFAKKDFSCFVTEAFDVVFGELFAFGEVRDPRVLLCDVDHVGECLGCAEQAKVLG